MSFTFSTLNFFISILDTLLGAYSLAVIAVCVISFVNPDPYNPIVRFLRSITEPAMWRIRKLLPFTYTGSMDFSPLVLLLGVSFIRSVLLPHLQAGLARLLLG